MLINRQFWTCDICGTEYGSEEEAKKCEAIGREGLPDSPSWRWYRLKSGNTETDIFGYMVKRCDCGPCAGRHLEIHSYCSNDYYCAPTNWKLLEILSPMEMAVRYGKLPSIFFRDRSDYPMNRPEPPEDVRAELERVFEWFRESEVRRLCREHGPEEIALMYLQAKMPHLGLF